MKLFKKKENWFKKLVKNCSKNNLDTLIYGASTESSLVLYKQILKNAINAKFIKIINEDLNIDFFNSLIPELETCIKNNVDISLIVAANSKTTNSEFAKLVENNGSLTVATNSSFVNCSYFIVVDGKSFNYTTNSSNKTISSFNRPNIGITLEKLFDYQQRKILINSEYQKI